MSQKNTLEIRSQPQPNPLENDEYVRAFPLNTLRKIVDNRSRDNVKLYVDYLLRKLIEDVLNNCVEVHTKKYGKRQNARRSIDARVMKEAILKTRLDQRLG